MCFTDKRKRNWIRKEDHVPDPVRPQSRVGYGGANRHTIRFFISRKYVLLSPLLCPFSIFMSSTFFKVNNWYQSPSS